MGAFSVITLSWGLFTASLFLSQASSDPIPYDSGYSGTDYSGYTSYDYTTTEVPSYDYSSYSYGSSNNNMNSNDAQSNTNSNQPSNVVSASQGNERTSLFNVAPAEGGVLGVQPGSTGGVLSVGGNQLPLLSGSPSGSLGLLGTGLLGTGLLGR